MSKTSVAIEGVGMHQDRQLVLHVGAPKTGTTAIQNVLYDHRQELLDRHNVLYPSAGLPGKGLRGHHNLVYEMSPRHREAGKFVSLAGGWRELAAELKAKSPSVAIVSAEGLLRQAKNVSEKLELFEGFDIHIVIYFRRQDEYLESGYNQLARFARVREGFESFVETRSSITNFRGVVQQWEKYAPNAKITCIPFQKKFIGSDVVSDFSRRFLSIPSLESPGVSNQRAGLKSIAAAKIVRESVSSVLGREIDLSVSAARSVRRLFTDEFDDEYDFSFCSRELQERILRDSRSNNEWLADRFPGFEPQTFFDLEIQRNRPLRTIEDVTFTSNELSRMNVFVDRLVSKTKRAARSQG